MEFAPGDRVAMQYFHPCRACRFYRTGRENIREQPLGFLAFATDGGFAEYVRVPTSALVQVPEALSTKQAAPLCCSATTAQHAAGIAEVGLGDTAVVYESGSPHCWRHRSNTILPVHPEPTGFTGPE